MTIPPAALQASNAKNDLVTAFFLCALSFLALQLVLREKLSLPYFVKLNVGWHTPARGPQPDLVVIWHILADKTSINVADYSLILSTNSVRVYVPKKPAPTGKQSSAQDPERAGELRHHYCPANLSALKANMRQYTRERVTVDPSIHSNLRPYLAF